MYISAIVSSIVFFSFTLKSGSIFIYFNIFRLSSICENNSGNTDHSTPHFDSTVPTIIDIERNWSYSWENLPNGMYKNPFLDEEVYTSSNNSSYCANEKKVAQVKLNSL